MTTEEVTSVHTHHGKRVDFNNIRPEDICLEDIAWSLAGQNRWTAHGNFPWFVTDHSLLVHERVKGDPTSTPVDHLRALTHDMHEAYESDLNHPLKMYLAKHTDVLKHLENRLDRAIAIALGFSHLSQFSQLVEKYDLEIRELEYHALFERPDSSPMSISGSCQFWCRPTQKSRAKYFTDVFNKQLAETLKFCTPVKFAANASEFMREAARSVVPQIKRMPRSWLEPPKPTIQKLMEALSTFQKENPDIKATLTFE